MNVLRHVGYWKSNKYACPGETLLHGQTTTTWWNIQKCCLTNLSQTHAATRRCNTPVQHTAAGRPNACNMLCPTMLRYRLRWNVAMVWSGIKVSEKSEYRAYTEACAHRSILSVWFPPPLIARKMSRNKALCYLQGEKAPVFCSCFLWLPLFFVTEHHQDQKTEHQCWAHGRARVFGGFTLCQRSIRTISPRCLQ